MRLAFVDGDDLPSQLGVGSWRHGGSFIRSEFVADVISHSWC